MIPKAVKKEEKKVEKTRSKSDDNPQENHVKVDYIMITKVKAHNKRSIKLTENGSYKNGRQKTITNCKSTFKIRFQSNIS